jgi:hypothetical protein
MKNSQRTSRNGHLIWSFTLLDDAESEDGEIHADDAASNALPFSFSLKRLEPQIHRQTVSYIHPCEVGSMSDWEDTISKDPKYASKGDNSPFGEQQADASRVHNTLLLQIGKVKSANAQWFAASGVMYHWKPLLVVFLMQLVDILVPLCVKHTATGDLKD